MMVTVIGGGVMGVGIAHLFLAHGHEVTLVEIDATHAQTAQLAVVASLKKALERGKLAGQLSEVLTKFSVSDRLTQTDAELVIEAVVEDMDLKRKVLSEAARQYPHATLASNTSSLSISELARGLPAERIIGMHFFNPVPVQPLIELVHHDGVHATTLEKVRAVAEELGKTTIEVRDIPGFATSRLGVAVGMEAIRMLEEEVATAEDIDTGMRLGYGWPMGPLRLTDLVGLDVRLAIAEHLTVKLGPRFAPPTLLKDKVARGELGRKTGKGFFTW
jgi:3-hydroxybutyryl-CoA dehydrogenase